jgi:protein-S-isoprenylcysteine O-methyltransferase Ste14
VLQAFLKTWTAKIAGQLMASLLKVILGAVGAFLMERGWTEPGSWEQVTGAILGAVAMLWAGAGATTKVKVPISVARASAPTINKNGQNLKGMDILPPY